MLRLSLPILACIVLGSCQRNTFDADLATRPYPAELHTTNIARMQVFRDGPKIEIVNASTTSYADIDIWINQRYVAPIESLGAGRRIVMSLRDFRDERGESFRAGGFFAEVEPEPLRLVEIQTSDTEPMIGLITIRAERTGGTGPR